MFTVERGQDQAGLPGRTGVLTSLVVYRSNGAEAICQACGFRSIASPYVCAPQ